MTAVMTDFACGEPDCDFVVPKEKRDHAAQSLSMHRRKHKPSKDVAVAKPKRAYVKKKPKVLDAFLQEQNVEVATAYVIAAKWPNGVPVVDLPRVVKLVKAVEHG